MACAKAARAGGNGHGVIVSDEFFHLAGPAVVETGVPLHLATVHNALIVAHEKNVHLITLMRDGGHYAEVEDASPANSLMFSRTRSNFGSFSIRSRLGPLALRATYFPSLW